MHYLDKLVKETVTKLAREKGLPCKLSTEEVTKNVNVGDIYPSFNGLLIAVGRAMSRLGYIRHRTTKQVFWIITK